MSDLYRSAISARAAKLPAVLPTLAPFRDDSGHEEDEDAEIEDSISSLPGPGLGPPAMQVASSITRINSDAHSHP
jgi:protein phosphatase methylesterase 1